MTKKKLDELNEEIKKAKDECGCCDHDHEEHVGCDCGCEDMYLPYDLENVHNSRSFANIFSIISKVLAIVYFIVSTCYIFTSYGLRVESYIYYNGQIDINFYLDLVLSFFSSTLLISILFVAFGEIVNLLNRIKESLY